MANPRLAQYKTLARATPASGSIAITSRARVIGRLIPALATPAPFVLQHFSEWRNRHRLAFFSHDEVTPESTARWLDAIAARDDRLLFLIATQDGRIVGHIGLNHLDETSGHGESDAWLGTGDKAAPGIMLLAFAAMLRWSFDALALHTVAARVFSDNAAVLRAHRMLGYRVTGETAFEGPAEAAAAPRRVTHLELDKASFQAE